MSTNPASRSTLTRAGITFAAAFLFAASPDLPSFAEEGDGIDSATTLQWTMTMYMPTRGAGGAPGHREIRTELAYKAPHWLRETRYDANGDPQVVDIANLNSDKSLQLRPKKKEALWRSEPTNVHGPPGELLKWLAKLVDGKPEEPIARRQVGEVTIDVYRYPKYAGGSLDLWIDAATGKPIQVRIPGTDQFDPDAESEEPVQGSGPSAFRPKRVYRDIVIGDELPDALFRLEAPDGFEMVER